MTMLTRALEIAKALIQTPGYAELPQKEQQVAEVLFRFLKLHGVDAEITEAAPGRPNVLAVHKGAGHGKTLLLTTHLDTVPAYDMPGAFTPEVRDGRLYGRGAVDVKGILAAMATVMVRLKEENAETAGDVIFLAVADEESGSLGMRSAIKDERIRKADFAVIGEPTGLQIGVAHKGVEWYQAVFSGKATHGGSPEMGINAITHASRFVQVAERQLIPRMEARRHPLLGHATMNIGCIDGGTRPTIVPDRCVVKWDRRILPFETYEEVTEEYRQALQALKAEDPQVEYTFTSILGGETRRFPPLSTREDEPGVRCAMSALQTATGRTPKLVGLPFWTDAALFPEARGASAVVVGPGDIAQAHSNLEYVPLNELEQAIDFYYNMAVLYSGG